MAVLLYPDGRTGHDIHTSEAIFRQTGWCQRCTCRPALAAWELSHAFLSGRRKQGTILWEHIWDGWSPWRKNIPGLCLTTLVISSPILRYKDKSPPFGSIVSVSNTGKSSIILRFWRFRLRLPPIPFSSFSTASSAFLPPAAGVRKTRRQRDRHIRIIYAKFLRFTTKRADGSAMRSLSKSTPWYVPADFYLFRLILISSRQWGYRGIQPFYRLE